MYFNLEKLGLIEIVFSKQSDAIFLYPTFSLNLAFILIPEPHVPTEWSRSLNLSVKFEVLANYFVGFAVCSTFIVCYAIMISCLVSKTKYKVNVI